MKKLIRHFRRWNIWRRRNVNGPLHHFLVLIGLRKSPTMMQVILKEEWEELAEKFCEGTGYIVRTEELKKLMEASQHERL